MPLSIYINTFHGIITIGDFVLTKEQILLKIIFIHKRKSNYSIEGIRYRSILDPIYNDIELLIPRIPFYSNVFHLLDSTAINEVVETKEIMKISTNHIVDIAFVFKADEVQKFLSDCCGRSNVFIIHYKDTNDTSRRNRSLIPIQNWQPFHNNNSYSFRIWQGLQVIGREIRTCLWSSYQPIKWSHSIAISNEVWLYFSQFLNLVCNIEERRMRRLIISYLPDLSLHPNFQIVPLQLIGIQTKDQLSMLQLLLGALTGIGIKKRMFEVDVGTKKKRRKFLSNGDLVKRIGPLPEEVNENDMKVKLRGTNKPGIDFVYDSSISLLKIQIRYTFLNIVAGPQLMLDNLLHDENKETTISLPNQIIPDETNATIVNKSFYDIEFSSWFKVKSILNENEVQVVLYDFMKDTELDETRTYDRNKAILLINQQEND